MSPAPQSPLAPARVGLARGREAEFRQRGEPVEGHDALVLLAVDHPRRIGAHGHLLTEIQARTESFRIAFHVRELVGGRPEPGLLLFARGSPKAAIEGAFALPQLLAAANLTHPCSPDT